MKKKCIYLIFLLVLFSCNSKTEKPFSREQKNDTQNINILLKEAINEGNINSYKKLASIYYDDNRYSDLYFYAMLMANKHKCSRAYYDLYTIMNRKGQTIDEIQMYSGDKVTYKLANYFLIKSYELGLKEAETNLKVVFGKNIPTSEEYLCNKH